MKLNYGAFNRPGDEYNQPADASLRLVIRDTIGVGDGYPSMNLGYILSALTETLEFAQQVPWPTDNYHVQERLSLNTVGAPSGESQVIVAENMLLHEFIGFGIICQISETLGVTTTQSLIHNTLVRVREVLAVDPTLNAEAVMVVLLQDALAASDDPSYGFGGTITETLDLVPNIVEQVNAMMIQSEMLSIAESIGEPQLWIYTPELAENLALSDDQQNLATLYDIIRDQVRFAIRFTDSDDSYVGWALNTRKTAASQYSNFNFNSMHRAKGVVYAGSSTGLYKLAGATDKGVDIAPMLTTSMLNLANGRQTRVPNMYMGVMSDAKLLVKTVTGEGVERWYESNTPVQGVETTRVILGRKPSARLWQFEITQRAPATDFELSRIELLPVILTRRVPNVK